MFNLAIGFVCSFLAILFIVLSARLNRARFLHYDLTGILCALASALTSDMPLSLR